MSAPECYCTDPECGWSGGWEDTQWLSDDLPECPDCSGEVWPIAEQWPEKVTP